MMDSDDWGLVIVAMALVAALMLAIVLKL